VRLESHANETNPIAKTPISCKASPDDLYPKPEDPKKMSLNIPTAASMLSCSNSRFFSLGALVLLAGLLA